MDLTKSQKLLYRIIQEVDTSDDKVKLAKFQYFSDFIHYAFHNQPISDLSNLYQKQKFGPLARNFNKDLEILISKKLIQQEGEYNYSIKKDIDVSLSKEEEKTIKYVLNKYIKYPFHVLVEISHKQIPYLSAMEGGIIEYDTAYNLVDEYADYQTV
ncbi:MAG: SocA family protein [Candidatus Pacebacteria bacterium]|nr:SocA family protein [Candidatus Paceibacterota bacterium]